MYVILTEGADQKQREKLDQQLKQMPIDRTPRRRRPVLEVEAPKQSLGAFDDAMNEIPDG